MDMKHKICDIRTWTKDLFLDISFININTLAHSHCQCIETRSVEVYWPLSQPLSHLRFNLFVISEIFATKVAFLADQTSGSH
jgi:hypothetical protein